MNALRTVVSALSIVVGVLLIALWALAQALVAMIEDGSAARAMTERALDSPALTAAVSKDLSGRTASALEDRGINVTALGLDGQLDQVMARAVGSEAFRQTLVNQVENAHRQIADQLSDPTRQPAPLSVSVDLSDSVNARISELGGVATALPALDIPPVSIQVLEAERFEQARDAYDKALWLQTWGLWLGIGTLLLGALVSHRRRWFVAKALFGLAAVSLTVAGLVYFVGPEPLGGLLPGGDDGVWAGLWRDVIGTEATAAVIERSLVIGVVALVGGLIAVAIGTAVGRRRR